MDWFKSLIRNGTEALFFYQTVVCVGLGAAATASFGQTVPTTFPDDSVPITRESYEQRVAGRVFTGQTAAGGSWRYDFKSDGQFTWYLTNPTGGGRIQVGKVRFIEGNLFCGDVDPPQASESTCNEVRIKDDLLLYKRVSNSEVVTLAVTDVGNAIPYEGTWTGRGFKNWDSELVIKKWNGSFRYFANWVVTRNDHCLSRDFPVTVVGYSSDSLTVFVRASQSLPGCADFSILMRRSEGATLKSRNTVFSR